MTDREEGFGFAPEDDAPIPYRQRIRDYYQALGYGAPYRWAHYAGVPFAPLEKPLAESRVALVTTAAPYQSGKGDQGPGAPYNAAPKFYTVYSGDGAIDPDLRIAHIAYDRDHTTAEDSNTWFPLRQLRRAAPLRSTRPRHARTTGIARCDQSALVTRLRVRCVQRWPPLPHLLRSGRLQSRNAWPRWSIPRSAACAWCANWST